MPPGGRGGVRVSEDPAPPRAPRPARRRGPSCVGLARARRTRRSSPARLHLLDVSCRWSVRARQASARPARGERPSRGPADPSFARQDLRGRAVAHPAGRWWSARAWRVHQHHSRRACAARRPQQHRTGAPCAPASPARLVNHSPARPPVGAARVTRSSSSPSSGARQACGLAIIAAASGRACVLSLTARTL